MPFIPNVLLVEDSPDTAALYARWLTKLGARVTIVDDGVDGAIAASEGDYDAVISDVNLPGVSGLLVAHEAKAERPHRPVMLITATQDLENTTAALREGVDDFLVKPFDFTTFSERVLRLLRTDRRTTTPAPRPARRTILAIGAHPDDVEIGIGGTLLKHRREGDRVVILTLSQGESGGPVDTRRAEASRAAELLQAELIMHPLPDTSIDSAGETIRAIERAVSELAPDIVYTHTARDNHQDHRAVAAATLVGTRTVPTLLSYQSPSTSTEFRPTKFVDVSRDLDAKLGLLTAYASQREKAPYLSDEQVRAAAAYWGRFAGYRHVEPLEVIREQA